MLRAPAAPTGVVTRGRPCSRCRTRRLRLSCAAATEAASSGTRLFVARKFAVDVGEDGPSGRRVRDYVRLPAERYNVLDSKAVQRVPGQEGTFRVSTGVPRSVTSNP